MPAWAAQCEAIFVPNGSDRVSASLDWLAESSSTRILIIAGTLPSELYSSLGSGDYQGEIILAGQELSQGNSTTSLLRKININVGNDLIEQIRKAVHRLAVRSLGTVRQVNDIDEMERYLRLRYVIWKQHGYIPEGKLPTVASMELDYTDRTSIPLCLFSAHGDVLGCTRLVKEMGEDEHRYVAYIQQLVDSAKDPILKDNFNLPRQLRQPFDVLEEFQGFRKYYSELVKARTAVGEVSRVIVRPEYERKGIGEALVDCMVDFSARKHVQRLFLACQERHVHLYGRSGFTVCRELRSSRFLHIPQASVIMERGLVA